MPIIRAENGYITQINVFTVSAPSDQAALIDLLGDAAEFCRATPGWISASLHRSLDGTRVVNYAQSRDEAAAQAVIERLRAAGYLQRNARLGTAQPGLYEVVATFGG